MRSSPKPSTRVSPSRWRPVPAWLGELGWIAGRSLFPIVALLLILGTVLWGPWVTLVLTFLWWRLVTRIG